jgi:DNA primase
LISINQEGMVFDFFSDRITIPIYDNNGYLVAFSGRTISNIEPKYLNTSSTSLFSKGNVLFNFHKAKFEHSDNIIIVEGFMDAIAYVRAGFKNVVATMGVALTNEHLSALRTSTNLNVVILSFDNDNAGNMATVANGQRLMQSGFNTYVVAEYDKDIKDVDELFHKSGKTAIENILNERIDFITFLINNEFINKKTTDEIQKSVVYILKSMIDFGSTSILLRQRHLKLLADKSGLAFEDLRAQFNFDLEKQAKTKKTHKKSYYSKLVKPDNEAGLPETFIEEESVVPSIAETQTKISRYLEDLEDNRKIKQKQLTDGYDSLILAFANSGNALTKYIEEISINSTDFDLGQQKFVLKGIQYLVGKDELLTEENLFNFLEIQSKTTNAIAKDYQKALIYFENLIEAPTYKSYSKRLLAKKQEERIEDIIYHITDVKYHLLIFNKLIKI